MPAVSSHKQNQLRRARGRKRHSLCKCVEALHALNHVCGNVQDFQVCQVLHSLNFLDAIVAEVEFFEANASLFTKQCASVFREQT